MSCATKEATRATAMGMQVGGCAWGRLGLQAQQVVHRGPAPATNDPRCIPLVPLYFASSPVKDATLEKAARSGLGFACRSGTFSMRSSLTGFRRSVADRPELKNLGRSQVVVMQALRREIHCDRPPIPFSRLDSAPPLGGRAAHGDACAHRPSCQAPPKGWPVLGRNDSPFHKSPVPLSLRHLRVPGTST